jgi:hypothetical protein
VWPNSSNIYFNLYIDYLFLEICVKSLQPPILVYIESINLGTSKSISNRRPLARRAKKLLQRRNSVFARWAGVLL